MSMGNSSAKVVSIGAYLVGFTPDPPLGNALRFIRRRDFLLIALKSDDGHVGWGEVFSSPFAAAALVKTKLAPLVLGANPLETAAIWHDMVGTLGYDRRGPAVMAVSAIDMALHDLAARIEKKSVAQMLGGALRTEALIYASGPFLSEGNDPYAGYPGQVELLLKRGFRAVKPRVGHSPRADGIVMRELRNAVGDDISLMVDINQGYTLGAAIESAKNMEEAGLLWIEEPLQGEDIPGYRALVNAVPCAIAGGEALGSLAAFRDFLSAGTFSILQPDLTMCGGYTGFRKIAALADAYDLPIMPHVFGTVVNYHAALQMAAVLPPRRGGGPTPYPFIEYDVTSNPLLNVLGEPTITAEGMVTVPQEIGTGIDLTPEVLEPWIMEKWSIELS